ncbi:hypothetical protein ABZY44_34425 [Streptomyces sp. NPDC006544]|uniref:hypothetical protein n=1 Tax=Streptomyces sp. NPDC006544 TaxID=3154583 RepID=UPI0033B4AD57
MSQTDMSPSDVSETDADRPSATLELLTLLAAGAAGPGLPAPDRLGRSAADRAPDGPRRSDLRERLTDGVVELRKRGEITTRRAAAQDARAVPGAPAAPDSPGTPDPSGASGASAASGSSGSSAAEHYLEAMARRAADRAGRRPGG